MVSNAEKIERYYLNIDPTPAEAGTQPFVWERSNYRKPLPSKKITPIQFRQDTQSFPEYLSILEKSISSADCPTLVDNQLNYYEITKEAFTEIWKNPYGLPISTSFSKNLSEYEELQQLAILAGYLEKWFETGDTDVIDEINRILKSLDPQIYETSDIITIALWKKQLLAKVLKYSEECIGKKYLKRKFSFQDANSFISKSNPQTDNTATWYRSGQSNNAFNISKTQNVSRTAPPSCNALPVKSPFPAALSKTISLCSNHPKRIRWDQNAFNKYSGKSSFYGTTVWSGNTSCQNNTPGMKISSMKTFNQSAWWGN